MGGAIKAILISYNAPAFFNTPLLPHSTHCHSEVAYKALHTVLEVSSLDLDYDKLVMHKIKKPAICYLEKKEYRQYFNYNSCS